MWIYRGRAGQALVQSWCRQRLDAWQTPHRRQLVHDDELGTTTHLVVAGEEHQHTVVFVPGRHGNAATSLGLIDALATRYRVIVVDLPGEAGLGSGGRPNTARLGDYGTWLDHVLAMAGKDSGTVDPGTLDPVTVVGHGFGAAVALAAPPTPRVRELILINPGGLIGPSFDPAATAALLAWRLAPSARSSARLVRALSGPRPSCPDLADWLQIVGRRVACSSTPPPHRELALRWRSTPCTVAVGAHDRVFPPARLIPAAGTVLGATGVVVAGAGYLLPYERPDAVVSLLGRGRHADRVPHSVGPAAHGSVLAACGRPRQSGRSASAAPHRKDAMMSDTRPACELHLVVEIVHRAGIVCELVEQDDAHQLIRARPRDGRATGWTVHAGSRSAEPHGPAAVFVGPADSTQVRVLRAPDERQVAALIVAQALHPDPTTAVSCAEVSALGLAPALLCTS